MLTIFFGFQSLYSMNIDYNFWSLRVHILPFRISFTIYHFSHLQARSSIHSINLTFNRSVTLGRAGCSQKLKWLWNKNPRPRDQWTSQLFLNFSGRFSRSALFFSFLKDAILIYKFNVFRFLLLSIKNGFSEKKGEKWKSEASRHFPVQKEWKENPLYVCMKKKKAIQLKTEGKNARDCRFSRHPVSRVLGCQNSFLARNINVRSQEDAISAWAHKLLRLQLLRL